MNEQMHAPDFTQPGSDEMASALFANMVVQQTNMALMFLGQIPHPETGKPVKDLETARMFIDTLEMLQVKTKGNLNKNEDALLKRNLTALRMAFVEASKEPSSTPNPQKAEAPQSTSPPEKPAPEGHGESAEPPEAESRKKFSKKY